MTSLKTDNRIEWIDTMRAFAIVLVLLAHYDGALLSKFANRSCVQMFFFISGLFAFSGRYTLGQYVKKQAQSLLLPYAVFAVINIGFHFVFNPSTPADELAGFAVNFVLARRNNVMVAAMWFLPCLFFASILYKAITVVFKEQKYIVPVCFAISAVFKLWFEDPVYVFSVNQGLKYLIYIALGGLLAPYIKNISLESIIKAGRKQQIAAAAVLAAVSIYISVLYKRGYVLWPESIWALAVVYFINVVVCILFFMAISLAVSKIKPICWVGRNTLGFCCMENINRALLNTAMALVGFGFVPDSEIKALAHIIGSMCIGSVIIIIINKVCPQLLGKKKIK
ncbi:MAG: acyltransferase [Oscillospiraceae bacterium]|nr:acyltransferase [Oscillospiraceae bacterium]